MAYRTVAVLGGTGNLGSHIVKALAKNGFSVEVFTQSDPAKAESAFSQLSKVKTVKVDYSSTESLVSAFKGIDAVVSVVGSFQINLQTTVIEAAVKAGVKRFIPSEFGADTFAPYTAEEPIYGGKRAVVKALKSHEDKMSWTGIVTGFFFDEEQGALLFVDPVKKTATIFGSGDAKVSVTRRHDIGEYVAAVLANPSQTANKVVRVAGGKVSQNELLSAFKSKTGAEGWSVKTVSLEELEAGGIPLSIQKLVAQGKAQIDRPVSGYNNKLDNDLFPQVKPRSVEHVISSFKL